MQTVFYIGATGYVGGTYSCVLRYGALKVSPHLGSVLVAIRKAHPDLKVTAVVRNPAHVDAVRRLGVEVIQGSFSDTNLITSRARESDITINMASSDDVDLNNAILAGQKARVVEDKKAPAILLHTSGTAIFMDDGKEGKHDPDSKVWNVSPCLFLGSVRSSVCDGQDGVEDDIRAITPEKIHGPVDVPYVLLYELAWVCVLDRELSLLPRILRASEEGYTESYIICPGAIVGPATGPVPAASFFFHFMSQLALGFKKAVYVGEGANIFYTVRSPSRVSIPIVHRHGAMLIITS